MDGQDEAYLAAHPDSTEEIPVLDISDYMAGKPGARERLGAELREISETIGFFYLTGHGVPLSLFDEVFGQSRRFHELPAETRGKMPKKSPDIPLGYESWEEKAARPGEPPANLSSSYLLYIERGPDNPHIDPADPYRRANAWPEDLPGFREKVLEYYNAVEKVGLAMMPIWAAALDLPADYFAQYFKNPWLATSLIYYPPMETDKSRPYGIKPHTDNTIMTILAQADVPGLAVQMPSGHWRVADIKPGAFMVNTGNSLSRWTNGRFLSTKHTVVNTSGKARYSIPVFFGSDLDTVIDVLPCCTSAEEPAKYPPITYRELQDWYFFGKGLYEKSMGPGTESKGRWLKDDAPAS